MAATGQDASTDEEWEEEETTVVVELSGILESDFISKCDGDCKVLGIDTEKPLLQLDRYTFSGEYADTVGTNLIFTQHDTPDTELEEPRRFTEVGDRPTKKLEYLCKVDKKLSMSRVFVSRTEPEDSEHRILVHEDQTDNDTLVTDQPSSDVTPHTVVSDDTDESNQDNSHQTKNIMEKMDTTESPGLVSKPDG